jgi:hypothetical protein
MGILKVREAIGIPKVREAKGERQNVEYQLF